MNSIRIQKVIQKEDKIDYQYDVNGDWKEYFREECPFFVQYSQNIEQIPASIAVLPLVGNVIVMAALLDGVIYVDEIDEDFYNSVEQIIEGYQQLSPEVHFKKKGLIHADKIVSVSKQIIEEQSLLFFSGGVDAWFSLLTHLSEKPELLSVWGADVAWDNEDGWKRACENCGEVAQRYELQMETVRAPLHVFRNEARLDRFSYTVVNDNWWSAFQHSVGMLCLAAPIVSERFSKIYFASTYSSKDKKDWGTYVIASDPKIDNQVKFCGCSVIHDGYEFSRYDKVKRICDYFQGISPKPHLRVCFSSKEGDNCGKCEKCAGTIMSVILSGEKPEDFGFRYDKEQLPYNFAAGIQEMAKEEKYAFLSLYYDIWKEYKNKYSIDQVPDVLKVFYSTDLEILADFLNVPCNKCEAGKEMKDYLDSVLEAQEWLEQQRNAWMQRTKELEQICEEKDAWIQELQEGKKWLEKEYYAWKDKAYELEKEIQNKQ